MHFIPSLLKSYGNCAWGTECNLSRYCLKTCILIVHTRTSSFTQAQCSVLYHIRTRRRGETNCVQTSLVLFCINAANLNVRKCTRFENLPKPHLQYLLRSLGVAPHTDTPLLIDCVIVEICLEVELKIKLNHKNHKAKSLFALHFTLLLSRRLEIFQYFFSFLCCLPSLSFYLSLLKDKSGLQS